MGKIKLGGYVFISWIGDHNPKHVHVYKDGKLIVKWDIKNWMPMKGKPNKKILTLIEKLIQEGKL